MPEVPKMFYGGLNQLLKLDEAWIKKRKRKHLYIRPFMIATGQGVIASPSDDYKPLKRAHERTKTPPTTLLSR
jgi:branched-chain amino acid aminotransferase